MLRVAWLVLRAITSLSRWIRRRFTIAGRVLLAAAAGAGAMGIDTERSMTYQAFALAGALLLIAAPFVRGFRPQLQVTRRLPAFATAGVPLAYRVRIENRALRDEAGLIVADQLADPRPTLAQYLDATAPAHTRSFIERHSGYARWRRLLRRRAEVSGESTIGKLRASEATEIECELMPHDRGIVQLATVTIARADPLGLIKATCDIGGAQRVCVLPRRYRLPPFVLPGARRYQRGGAAPTQSVGDSDEFVSLRAYRPGDPLQRVHWKSFARVGEPIVKEMQDEFFEHHCLLLDNAVGRAREAAFEASVSIAASFVCAIDTHDCLLDLMLIGAAPVCVTGGPGLLQTERLLELLAAAKPHGQDAIADIARTVLDRCAGLTSLILVTSQWDDARCALAERLRALGVSVLALVVVESGAAVAPSRPWAKPITLGSIEADLERALA